MLVSKQQQECLSSIFNNNNNNLDFISSDYSLERLNIYKNNIFETLFNVIKITYPETWQLLDNYATSARSVVYKYISNINNLPDTGCLDDWGEGFCDFLFSYHELKYNKIFVDYAKFEWCYYQAQLANKSPAIEPQELLNYTEQGLTNLKIKLRDEVVLYRSDYDIKIIHDFFCANYNNNLNKNKILDLEKFDDSKITLAVILKKYDNKNNNNIAIFWLDNIRCYIWYFLYYLHNNKTFGEAVELLNKHNNFDLVSTLNFILSNGFITKVE